MARDIALAHREKNDSPTTAELDDLTPTVALEHALLMLLGAALGVLLAVVVAPRWLPALATSLRGSNPKAYWYLARGSGIVAYLLLWMSVALGLMITNRLARVWPGGPAAVDLHQFASLLALAFALYHVLILLGDRYIDYTLFQLLVPFASRGYRPFWVGLGQMSFYLAGLVAFSFYTRGRIGRRTWRLLHYSSFAVYLLVTAHALAAGTDTRAPAVMALYGLTGLITYFLTVYRILVSTKQPRSSIPKQAWANIATRSAAGQAINRRLTTNDRRQPPDIAIRRQFTSRRSAGLTASGHIATWNASEQETNHDSPDRG